MLVQYNKVKFYWKEKECLKLSLKPATGCKIQKVERSSNKKDGKGENQLGIDRCRQEQTSIDRGGSVVLAQREWYLSQAKVSKQVS